MKESGGDQLPEELRLPRLREAAGAGVALAPRRLHREEALAADGDVDVVGGRGDVRFVARDQASGRMPLAIASTMRVIVRPGVSRLSMSTMLPRCRSPVGWTPERMRGMAAVTDDR